MNRKTQLFFALKKRLDYPDELINEYLCILDECSLLSADWNKILDNCVEFCDGNIEEQDYESFITSHFEVTE